MNPNQKPPEAIWILIVTGLLSFFILASTLWILYLYKHDVFYQDHWRTSKLFDAYLRGKLNFGLFWEQNGRSEHRLIFPRILFLLDYRIARGTGYSLILMTVFIQVLQALLLGRALQKNLDLAGWERLFFFFLGIVDCFWLVQSGNMIWGFQVAWFLNGLAASLAAFLICRINDDSETRTWLNILGAALCCIVSTYSVANGLFMCLVLLGVILKIRLPRQFIFFWIFFSAALGASYLYHLEPESGRHLWKEIFNFQAYHYFLVYMGNPVSRFSLAAGTLVGLTGLGLFFLFARRLFREKRPGFFLKFGLAQMSYVLLTAMATALGRNDNGVDHASSSRYYTPVLLFWFFACVLVYTQVAGYPKTAKRLRLGVLLALFCGVLPVQLAAPHQRKIRYVKNDEAALALITGVQDSSALHFALLPPDDTLIWEQNYFLRTHQLSVYHEPWTLTMGHNIHQDYGGDSDQGLQGEVDEARPSIPLYDGYYVSGKVHASNVIRQPEVILFANNGKIVGFAKTTHRRCSGCFSGYIKGSENERFEMFGLNPNGSLLSKIQVNKRAFPRFRESH